MGTMRYFYRKRIDKDPDTVFLLLDTFWKEFVALNQGEGRPMSSSHQSEISPSRISPSEIRFPRRVAVMKSCGLSRRNAYKHIRKLIIYNVFVEENRLLAPTSFLFEINGRLYNPSSHLFDVELPRDVRPDSLFRVQSRMRPDLIVRLLEAVRLDGGRGSLRDHVSLAFDVPDHFEYSQAFPYAEFPKTLRLFDGWEQKDPEIANEERRLLSLLTPGPDPFSNSVMLQMNPDDKSPFFQVDQDTQEYVLAGWCARRVGDELRGDVGEPMDSGASIECYTGSRELVGLIPLDWRSGAPLAQVLTVASRSRSPPEGNLVGWYDFRTALATGRFVHDHVLVSFVRFTVPMGTRFCRIVTGDGVYLVLVSIFPASRLPKELLVLRRESPSMFVQDAQPIMHVEDCGALGGLGRFRRMNAFLAKASMVGGAQKQALLRKALAELDAHSVLLPASVKSALSADPPSKSMSGAEGESFMRMLLSACGTRLLLSLSIHGKSKAEKAHLRDYVRRDLGLVRSVMDHLARPRASVGQIEYLPLLVMTAIRQFRDAGLAGDVKEAVSFRRWLEGFVPSINKVDDVQLRLEVYKILLRLDQDMVSAAVLAGRRADTGRVIADFASIAGVYEDLASRAKRWVRPGDALSVNRHAYFRNQALFYRFCPLAFQARMLNQARGGPETESLLNSLEKFGKELF